MRHFNRFLIVALVGFGTALLCQYRALGSKALGETVPDSIASQLRGGGGCPCWQSPSNATSCVDSTDGNVGYGCPAQTQAYEPSSDPYPTHGNKVTPACGTKAGSHSCNHDIVTDLKGCN
jgi:hypothetical protein